MRSELLDQHCELLDPMRASCRITQAPHRRSAAACQGSISNLNPLTSLTPGFQSKQASLLVGGSPGRSLSRCTSWQCHRPPPRPRSCPSQCPALHVTVTEIRNDDHTLHFGVLNDAANHCIAPAQHRDQLVFLGLPDLRISQQATNRLAKPGHRRHGWTSWSDLPQRLPKLPLCNATSCVCCLLLPDA